MWNRKCVVLLPALLWLCLPAAGHVFAGDEEGCLFCHRLDLRVSEPLPEGRDLRVWETPGGLHAALYCTDCHPDAGKAPHAAAPGPAQCIGECHGQSAAAKESHRRASFGGLIEIHRSLASPGAPCRMCHRAADKDGRIEEVIARCAGCHARERESIARGVHARLAGGRGVGMCPDCHAVHTSATGGGKASCAGAGCHASVTEGMRRLTGHKGGEAQGGTGRGAAEAGIVLGFAVIGLVLGRRLSPGEKGDGGTG